MRGINHSEQLEQWIDEYQNLIYTICFRMTGDYFEAQDLTQETFLSAYKCSAYFDGHNPRAWLCRIASNKCLDYLKANGRRQIPTDDRFFLTYQDSSPPPERSLTEKDIRQQLYACCMQLKSPYREAALDYYYYEMDIQQMAAKTGKNIKTLQTHIYRAKAMLRKMLRKEDLEDG